MPNEQVTILTRDGSCPSYAGLFNALGSLLLSLIRNTCEAK